MVQLTTSYQQPPRQLSSHSSDAFRPGPAHAPWVAWSASSSPSPRPLAQPPSSPLPSAAARRRPALLPSSSPPPTWRDGTGASCCGCTASATPARPTSPSATFSPPRSSALPSGPSPPPPAPPFPATVNFLHSLLLFMPYRLRQVNIS